MYPHKPSSPQLISSEEFKLFHEMDRKLYSLLAMDLWRDPKESMKVMALWLWMERNGCNKAIERILSFPNFLINELAEEAVTCLNCLDTNSFLSSSSDPSGDIPLTQSMISNDLSLQFLHENRLTVIQGLSSIINEVCARALKDIMQRAMESRRMIIPLSTVVRPVVAAGGGTLLPPDERTMFVTFSRGYPVPENDIREFFAKLYGDCIESLYMQEVQPGEQSLFARIVFYSPSSIDMILNGGEKAKFTINGRHVWMRKFVPRRQKSNSSPSDFPATASSSTGSTTLP